MAMPRRPSSIPTASRKTGGQHQGPGEFSRALSSWHIAQSGHARGALAAGIECFVHYGHSMSDIPGNDENLAPAAGLDCV
jgi:hypothetical protein